MESTELFELAVGVVMAIIALHYAARRLNLPPSLALLAGGSAMAFTPGIPAIEIDPELVLVIFLPPLLLDGAWSIPVQRLRRHKVGVAALAVGAVVFTTVLVAWAAHALVPTLPWAACAALGAIVAPPDAVSARAVLERVVLPRRLRILLEGESLLNDASGLVLFRFAIAAAASGMFNAVEAVGTFFALAIGGAMVGAVVGFAWVKLVRRLGDDYLIIAATALLAWASYLLGEALHVSGVIATVFTGLIASWHQHTVMTASTRMRGSAFWDVVVFLLEAAVFILIGLSLRDVLDRAGGPGVVFVTMGSPLAALLLVLVASRFAWVFGSDAAIRLGRGLKLTEAPPLGLGGATVLSWAGMRGVVTLAMALSVPNGFPGRDFILVAAFAVIAGTVVLQGSTLGYVIRWAKLTEPDAEKPKLTMSQAEAAMFQEQLTTVRRLAYDEGGQLIHPMLLSRYERKASAGADYAERTEEHMPLLHAHFDVILAAVATGRGELLRLHRLGDIDDETLNELEHDLDLEELGALSAKA